MKYNIDEDLNKIKSLMGVDQGQQIDLCNNNHKPAVEFDKFFNTRLSQTYVFPFNLDGNSVWRIICNCENNNKDCERLRKIADNLTYDNFPYNNVEKLEYETKVEILAGMASEFNYSDIIWWAIENMKGEKYEAMKKRIKTLVSERIYNKITWHISPDTFDLIKNSIK